MDLKRMFGGLIKGALLGVLIGFAVGDMTMGIIAGVLVGGTLFAKPPRQQEYVEE